MVFGEISLVVFGEISLVVSRRNISGGLYGTNTFRGQIPFVVSGRNVPVTLPLGYLEYLVRCTREIELSIMKVKNSRGIAVECGLSEPVA